jgi:hypothetical protein
MVSLVLMVLVAAVALRLFLRQHWTGIAQSETAALQSTLRAGLLFLTSELRELGGTPGDADILVFAAESLTYRAMRGAGMSCSRSPNSILLDAGTFAGYRSTQPGRDSMLLHVEGRVDTEVDDRWLHLPLVAAGVGTCGGASALDLSTALDTTLFPARAFAPLAPVRTFEVMQIKLYQSGGEYWLGARSVSAGETIQPVVGPLTSGGLLLTYLDPAGGTATMAESIRGIGITLRAMSSNPIRSSGGSGTPSRRIDSLITTVTLRNW